MPSNPGVSYWFLPPSLPLLQTAPAAFVHTDYPPLPSCTYAMPCISSTLRRIDPYAQLLLLLLLPLLTVPTLPSVCLSAIFSRALGSTSILHQIPFTCLAAPPICTHFAASRTHAFSRALLPPIGVFHTERSGCAELGIEFVRISIAIQLAFALPPRPAGWLASVARPSSGAQDFHHC